MRDQLQLIYMVCVVYVWLCVCVCVCVKVGVGCQNAYLLCHGEHAMLERQLSFLFQTFVTKPVRVIYIMCSQKKKNCCL